MGLNHSIKLTNFINDELLRIDTKFHILNSQIGWNIFEVKNQGLLSLKSIFKPYYENFDYQDDEVYKGIPTGKEYLNEFGDIIGYQTVTKEEHPNRIKYKANNNCILISSLKGARTPALTFDFDLSDYIFSNGFYIFEVSKNWNKKFVLYLLRTDIIKNVLDNHIYRGIGISSYQESDFLKIQIPNISLDIQNQAVKKIEPIEQQIQNLKSQKKDHLEIINEVFAKELKINISQVNELDRIKTIDLRLSHVDDKNDLFRMSYKWHKLETTQSCMYENLDCVVKLGKYILQTKNGWSPESSEIEDGIAVLGQEHILKKGVIDLNPSKYTTLTKNNIQDFFVKQNDFFVSRGNTVELVALAGIVEEDIEQDIIYPDLYIKIDFDEEFVDKQYMAFMFNSFIGRIYFKHVAKGKNQTMVKVSSKELLDFYLPLPEITIQQQIVEQIKSQIDVQKLIDEQIEQKQKKISEIIYSVIKGI